MKISVLVPDLRPGGAERVSVNLANAFVRAGFSVTIVLMRNQGLLRADLDPEIRILDLGATRPRYVLIPLIRLLRKERPAAVVANMWPLTVLAVLARRLARIRCRLMVVEHTTWSVARLTQRWQTRLMIKAAMRIFLPGADAVVAVSKGAAADLERFAGLPKGVVQTIYNPVVTNQVLTPLVLDDYAPGWCADGYARVLAVGTLKPVKDFPTLLRAFARLRESVPAKLLILGEGDERKRLEALADSLGIADSIEMPGFVADTRPFYSAADLFVLSSEAEGFGNVIVESLEQGVAVVSTDCPSGPREILDDGKYGTLVPIGDVDVLAEAMEDALGRDHDVQGLKRRAQDFSVEKAADAYLDLLLPNWRKGAAA